MNYEDFCHIASVCTEQIGPKCRRFFSPSNFMKFEKDEQGRIAILPFYLYVMRTVYPLVMNLAVILRFIFYRSVALFFYTLWLFKWIYMPLLYSHFLIAPLLKNCDYTGFTNSSKNRYERAGRGFWWLSSTSCMSWFNFHLIQFQWFIFYRAKS